MIAFFDTSSVVKLYVEEPGSSAVHELASASIGLFVCRIAYPEFRSALARRTHDGGLTAREGLRVRKAFDADWSAWVRLDFDERLAGELAAKHLLRGMDAVHLAAAVRLLRGAGGGAVTFSSFDKRLNRAAIREGFEVAPA